jgi:hypothetical protein
VIADPKRVATVQARCALTGVALTITTDDRERPLYVASRDEMCKSFLGLEEVEAWLERTAEVSP